MTAYASESAASVGECEADRSPGRRIAGLWRYL